MNYKINDNYFHIFRRNDKLNMQNSFVFVDTETTSIKKDNLETLNLKLGWAIYWNRKENIKEYKHFITVKEFWIWFFNITKEDKDIYFYAHNTDFDFKILNGLENLLKNYGYLLENFYVEGTVYILNFKKGKQKIHILDTMNYIPCSLKKLGKSIGLSKKDIDFNKCSFNQLSNYCKNDVEIIFLFIKSLIEFLTKYELSKLKSTVSSLSLNIYRHKFYNKKQNPIFIHNWLNAINLEKHSYKGGICDCIKIGNFKEKLYKLDINSMYPYIMKNYNMPTKLIFYSNKTDK